MQTFLSDHLRNTTEGREADRILRSCVHCGFCTATCPTYRLLGDERDSPRGRIYLIKGLLEGKEASDTTLLHLDRCLTCLSCETHCPSGVEYGHLLEIGRRHIEAEVKRPLLDRLFRRLLRLVLPYRRRFTLVLRAGQLVRPFLPVRLKKMVPPRVPSGRPIAPRHERRMILFAGCVQPALSPGTNRAASVILDRLAIGAVTVRGETCCGAIDYHMAEPAAARKFITENIEHWWPLIEAGVEAIVTTASGCGAMIKEYGYILREDPRYRDKAKKISSLTRDISEIVAGPALARLESLIQPRIGRLAFHNPCTLQHGQRLADSTETLLRRLGFELSVVPDSHLCCGSAGVYSLLQPELSARLQAGKIRALLSGGPEMIATANIGCQMHLQQATDVPVRHWIEIVEEACR